MPNCFQLTRKGETEPTKLTVIDDFICNKLNEEPDPERWCRHWMDTLGLGFALGRTFDELRKAFADTDLIEVIDILEEHFLVNAWVQRKH
jgi:hypothetical protein